MDWLSFDLAWEGSARLVGGELDRSVPTCTIEERAGDVRERFSSSALRLVVFDDLWSPGQSKAMPCVQ
jgi:hypothetical protein